MGYGRVFAYFFIYSFLLQNTFINLILSIFAVFINTSFKELNYCKKMNIRETRADSMFNWIR